MTEIEVRGTAHLRISGGHLGGITAVGELPHLVQQARRDLFGLHDKKLAAIGVWAGVGHRQRTAVIAQLEIELVLKAIAPDALAAAAVPLGIAALDHEIVDDAMEDQAVVIAVLRMGRKILHRLGRLLRE